MHAFLCIAALRENTESLIESKQILPQSVVRYVSPQLLSFQKSGISAPEKKAPQGLFARRNGQSLRAFCTEVHTLAYRGIDRRNARSPLFPAHQRMRTHSPSRIEMNAHTPRALAGRRASAEATPMSL